MIGKNQWNRRENKVVLQQQGEERVARQSCKVVEQIWILNSNKS